MEVQELGTKNSIQSRFSKELFCEKFLVFLFFESVFESIVFQINNTDLFFFFIKKNLIQM